MSEYFEKYKQESYQQFNKQYTFDKFIYVSKKSKGIITCKTHR